VCSGRLTRTLLDTEGSIGVLCSGVVFQLEGGGVVDKGLGALGHTRPTVIEVGAGLQVHTHRADTVLVQVFRLFTLLKGSFYQMKHSLTYPCMLPIEGVNDSWTCAFT